MEYEHSKRPCLDKSNVVAINGKTMLRIYASSTTPIFGNYFNQEDGSSSSNSDDIIDFLEEENQSFSPNAKLYPWKILITDDDANVHETTLLALSGVRIHGRPLEFLHAYSAKEAKTIIIQHPDLALILLDVVMETVDAGLKLVQVIRDELGRANLRIVLRTGQPGYAPEELVSHQLAIDGYTTKSKLTRSLLISVLHDTLAEPDQTPGLPN
ncbi:response regulator [Undibacterium sp. RuRC25W]|uniref:response regulator n=1 Tax=Undibacterium sp. RuRC25W TaxID=3413047 RepID=UPI003BEFB257